MKIKIGPFEISECWDGVFYKKLSEYPKISDWECQNLQDFIRYEKAHGRTCSLFGEESVLQAAEQFLNSDHPRVDPPDLIKECTACPTYKGCRTDLVCHTSPIENAVKILDCGSLLSPKRARKLPAEALFAEKRNAAKDPEDYFEYIMFAWGNCQAGDRLVNERKLGRFPKEEDLGIGFTPGVRFFFRYETLIHHPMAVYDGVLPLKVKDEVLLKDWVWAILSPDVYREVLELHIPEELRSKTHFLKSEDCDIWEWSERVYEYARNL